MLNSTPADVFGGVEQWMVRAARGLSSRGHTVGICARPRSMLAERSAGADLAIVAGAGGADYDPLRSAALARAARRNGATIAIVNYNKDLIQAARARRRSPLRHLVMRSVLPMLDTSVRHQRLYRRHLDGIITPSREVRRTIEAYPWMQGVRVQNIPNGIELARVDRARARYGGRGPTRTAFGFTPDHFVIGGVGRLEPHKGFQDLLEAAVQLAHTRPLTALVLVGSGSMESELRTRAEAVARGNLQIVFTGHLDDPDAVMPAFDVLVLPSTTPYETFGQVLIEAMAFHVPVIGSRIGGIPEIIKHGQNGLLVDPGEVDGLASELHRLAVEPELRRRFARVGRRCIEEHYREETMIERLERYLFEMGRPEPPLDGRQQVDCSCPSGYSGWVRVMSGIN